MQATNSNIPNLSVDNVIEQLTASYTKIINAGLSPKVFPSVMLWGPPGVGKSQAIRQIGKNIEQNTNKKVAITDVRLLLFNPIDLRGRPTANAEKTLAIWLKPQIFQMNPDDDVINILFLDEISAAPQSVQAAAYQITLDRVVGEHKLPDNCIVLAAGNRTTDRSVSIKTSYFSNAYVEPRNKARLYKQIDYLLTTIADVNNYLLTKENVKAINKIRFTAIFPFRDQTVSDKNARSVSTPAITPGAKPIATPATWKISWSAWNTPVARSTRRASPTPRAFSTSGHTSRAGRTTSFTAWRRSTASRVRPSLQQSWRAANMRRLIC